jgi:dienelactone hydrolase
LGFEPETGGRGSQLGKTASGQFQRATGRPAIDTATDRGALTLLAAPKAPLIIPAMSLLGSLASFFSQPDVSKSSDTFLSGGKTIRIDSFLPNGETAVPAVIALHGSTGMEESFSDRPARMLAAQGYAVFLLHYFDRTGTVDQPSPQEMRDLFPEWMVTIGDAITYATELSNVERDCTALVGFSLGAYLALAMGATDPRVKAVIDFCGGLPEQLLASSPKLPPTLIFHGEDDRSVPVAEAHKIRDLAERTSSICESKLYPGEGHYLSAMTMLDAAQRVPEFLRRHLRDDKTYDVL